MKFKLNIQERLVIISILPVEANFINLGIIRKVSSILEITDDEAKDIGLKRVEENLAFDVKKGMIEKDFDISERAYSIICEVFEKIEKEKKLTEQHYTAYKKFVEDFKK